MMKNVKIALLIVALLPFVANAQSNLSHRQKRVLNLKALTAIEQYEASQHLNDMESEFLFESVFTDPNMLVFCDLVDYKSCQMIPLREYMAAIKRRPNLFMEIGDLKRGAPTYKDGKWVLPISFTKSVNYIDKNGLHFSTDSYFGSNYEISMEMSYDESNNKCYVTNMTGRLQNSDRAPLPYRFMVIQKSSKFDEKLRYGKKDSLVFNNGYAFVADRTKELQAWNYDAHIKADTIDKMDSYDLVKFRYRKSHMRVKLRGAMAVGNVFNVKASSSDISTKSFGYEAGLDIGVAFFAGKSSQIGIYTGAAWTSTGLTINYNGTTDNRYSLNLGGAYTPQYGMSDNSRVRTYTIANASESLAFTDITIPMYLNFEHYLHKSVVLTWNLGAKLYINGKAEYSPLRVVGSYEDKIGSTALSPVEIDTQFDSYLQPTSYIRDDIDFSAVAGIALNINLYKNYVYTYAKFSFEYGLHDFKFDKSHDRKSLINNVTERYIEPFCESGSKNYPIVFDGTTGKNIANKSLLNSVAFNRQTMWVEFGFMFKF